jgi:hypothetical protein
MNAELDYFSNTETMSKDMLKVIEDLPDMVAEYQEVVKALLATRKAMNVTLPAEAADGGKVTHGARQSMKRAESYWMYRIQAIRHVLPRGAYEFIERPLNDGKPLGISL